ncbi:MAG: BON domain-containing protein [Burkholderia sp.]
MPDPEFATPPGVRMMMAGPGRDDLPRAEPPAAGRGSGRDGLADRDAEIDRDVHEAIAPVLDAGAGRVSIEVRQAHVTLDGCVPSAKLRDAIGQAAAQCPNVASVDNRIAVEPSAAAPVVLTPERRTVTMNPAGRPGRRRS